MTLRRALRFVAESGPQLYRVAYLLTGRVPLAEDLYQDALIRAFASWRRVRREDAYRYVRRVVVNLHTDWWRSPRSWRERSWGTVPETGSGDDPTSIVADRDQLVRALRGLTRRQRAVIVLRYFADLSERDTAEELGVSIGTVKSTTAKALAALRRSPDLMADRAPEPLSTIKEMNSHEQC